MSWLFWILLIVFVMLMIQGLRKGMARMAISMVSFILVIIITSWLNPYVGDFIREKTSWEENIQEKTNTFLAAYLETMVTDNEEGENLLIEELPLPQVMREKLQENNTVEGYKRLAVENFADYLSKYISYGVINGIGFLVSFMITNVIMHIIMYAVDLITELPVIGFLNRIGGMILGAVQAILWISVFFVLVTLLYQTKLGGYLLQVIKEDSILAILYDQNILVNFIMRFLS